MRRTLPFAIAFAFVALVAAGCGGSSKPSATKATSPTPSTSTTTSPTSTTAHVSPADQALANQAVLSLSDLPPGWTSKPHTDQRSAKADAQIRACLHLSGPKLIVDAANADSPDFTSPTHQQITNSVGVATTASDVARVLDVISGPRIPDCLAQALDTVMKERSTSSRLPPGSVIGKVTVSPESFASLGSRTVAYQISVPVTAQGLNISVYVDLILVQQGRVGVLLTAEATFAPFPTDMSTALIRKVLSRVGSAT